MPWQDSSVVEQRLRLVEVLVAGGDVAATCRRFGVSRQTGYKYLSRFKKFGGVGLADQPRRPRQPHQPQADCWRKRVLQLRRHRPTWGARKLRWQLRQSERRASRLPSERTIQRWLRSAGLIKRRAAPRRSAPPERTRKGTLARRSNHVWTIDLKGWFTSADHKKVEPLTVRDQWSRFILYACHLSPRDERGVRRVCTRLFRRYGVPQVIRCDRGAPFFGDGPHGFSRLSLWWWRLGIRVEFVRRGYVNNNAHEQMHRVLKAEASAPAPHWAAQLARLQRWRHDYNHCRPHEALRMRPPILCYRPQPGPCPDVIEPKYPAAWIVRRVRANGEISCHSWRGSIGRAFAGLCIGLKPAGTSRYHVYFASLRLGQISPSSAQKLSLSSSDRSHPIKEREGAAPPPSDPPHLS